MASEEDVVMEEQEQAQEETDEERLQKAISKARSIQKAAANKTKKGKLPATAVAFMKYVDEDPDSRQPPDRDTLKEIYDEWSTHQPEKLVKKDAETFIGVGTVLFDMARSLGRVIVRNHDTLIWVPSIFNKKITPPPTSQANNKKPNGVKPTSYITAVAPQAAAAAAVKPTAAGLASHAIQMLMQANGWSEYNARCAFAAALGLELPASPIYTLLISVITNPQEAIKCRSVAAALETMGFDTTSKLSIDALERVLCGHQYPREYAAQIMRAALS
jgi:hypothetical protein